MSRTLLIGSIDIYLSDKLLHSLSEGGTTGPKYCINKQNTFSHCQVPFFSVRFVD